MGIHTYRSTATHSETRQRDAPNNGPGESHADPKNDLSQELGPHRKENEREDANDEGCTHCVALPDGTLINPLVEAVFREPSKEER